MSKTAWAWIWFVFLLIVDVSVPWIVLTHVESISGSFLFWVIWVIAAIISAFIIFMKWQDVAR